MSDKTAVLFVCTHNAGRSALAAALARTVAGDRLQVDSAGNDPSDGPSPVTIASLAELGIDDSGHQPSKITEARVCAADVVVAMKPGLHLPKVPGVRYETWAFPDPADWTVDSIRELRDAIQARVERLTGDLQDDGARQSAR